MIYQGGLRLVSFILFFFSIGSFAMANEKISVSVESTNIVYDIRINGIPLIKSKDVKPRSLQIPAYEFFKTGNNKIEVNFVGITRDGNNQVVPELDKKTSIYISLVRDGTKIGVLSIYYDAEDERIKFSDKTYAGQVRVEEGSGIELIEEDMEFDQGEILLGRKSFKSYLTSANVSIANVATLNEYWDWEKGEEIVSEDAGLLKGAYQKFYESVIAGPEVAIEPFINSYKLVAMKYYSGSFEDYLEEYNLLDTFSEVRVNDGNFYRISKPDFNKSRMEILGDGKLARFYPDPLKWYWNDRKIDSGIIFYKSGNKFIPFTIVTDLSF
jgi:hypothetical protein